MSQRARKTLEDRAKELGVHFTKSTSDADLTRLVEEAEIASTITVLDRKIPERSE